MENIIGKLFKSYCEEILKDILPKQHISGIASNDSTITSIHLNNKNEAFIDSNYYVPVSNKKFLHFTSLEKLNNILLDKHIRLYDLNYVDDKNEILFPFKYCNLSNASFNEHNIDDLRKNIYSFSFCDTDNQELDEYNMWRFYGNDGNGIAILFSFKNDEKAWDGFHLSKIYYNQEKLLNYIKNAFQRFNDYIDKLAKDEGYQKGKEYFFFLNQILSLLSFHKVNIYKSENEFRLIYQNPSSQPLKQSPFYIENNKVINRAKTISKFFKVPIALNDQNEVGELIPLIEIEEIIFGYRYREEDFHKLKKSLNEIMVYNSIKAREFKMTDLKDKYFQ